MKALRFMALASLLASTLILSGCPDDTTPADAGGGSGDIGVRADGGDAMVAVDGGADGGVGMDAEGMDALADAGLTFPGFIHDLINNHTNETESAVDLPSPDLPDNEDPTNYDDLFP